jgi:hypothetical protein
VDDTLPMLGRRSASWFLPASTRIFRTSGRGPQYEPLRGSELRRDVGGCHAHGGFGPSRFWGSRRDASAGPLLLGGRGCGYNWRR